MTKYEKAPSVMAIVVALLILFFEIMNFPGLEWVKYMNEKYPGYMTGWVLARIMIIGFLSFIVFKLMKYAIRKTYGEVIEKEHIVITKPEQTLEEATKFFKEFYTEIYWEPLIEAEKQLKNGNRQQAVAKINEALFHMDSLRSKRAKKMKAKLEILAKEIK